MGVFPQWMKPKKTSPGLAGLWEREDGVALARVSRKGDRPQLQACAFISCSEGAERARLLQEAARENSLAGSRSVVMLDNGTYSLLQVDPPEVAEGELREAVRWQIRDLIDFPLEEGVVDAFMVPPPRNRSRMAYVAAARLSQVRRCCDMARGARLKVEAVDIPELAMRNIAVLLPEDPRGVAFLHLAPRRGMLTVTRNGLLYFARSLNVGIEALLAEIPAGEDAQAPMGYRAVLDSVVLEIQRSLDFYESTFGQLPVGQLVVAPLERDVPGLLPYLKNYLGIGVRLLDLGEILQLGEIPTELQGQCLAAIGAALRAEA